MCLFVELYNNIKLFTYTGRFEIDLYKPVVRNYSFYGFFLQLFKYYIEVMSKI